MKKSENIIHPTAIIGNDVVLGVNNIIGPYSIIEGKTIIGNNNTIGPYVLIGCLPTDSKFIDYEKSKSQILIGNDNIIREYCLIEQPCYEDKTIINNAAFLMQGVHVSHDVNIHNRVVITNLSVLAGIVKILEGASISMACTINQYTVIGHYSITATNSAVMKNVKPFSKYIPGKPISVNTYAIKKYNFEQYEDEIIEYVLNNIPMKSEAVRKIMDEFDYWVAKYNRPTY